MIFFCTNSIARPSIIYRSIFDHYIDDPSARHCFSWYLKASKLEPTSNRQVLATPRNIYPYGVKTEHILIVPALQLHPVKSQTPGRAINTDDDFKIKCSL